MRQLAGICFALVLLGSFASDFGFHTLTENLPAEHTLSRQAYVALAILSVAALLWITEAVPLFVTSLFVLLLCIVWLLPVMQDSGIDVDRSEFLQQFFSDIILLFLGGFTLSAAMHKLQLDLWLSQKVIAWAGPNLPKLMLSVLITTAFLSMWLSNTATTAMMLALVLPIALQLPTELRQPLILSVPFAANIGGLGTPIGSPPNAIAMEYLQQTGNAPSFLTWLIIGSPSVVGMLLLAWGTLLWMCPNRDTSFEMSMSSVSITPNWQLWLTIGTILATIAGWMTSAFHQQSSGTVALVPVLVFFASRILNVRDLRALPWDVLLLMGGGLCLGTAISESGLADWIVSFLPSDSDSIYWNALLLGSVACVMSSVMSNTATANLIMPIALGMSETSPEPLLVGVAFACTLAMPLPVSTPPNAMAFSTEQISVSAMLKPGLAITLVGIVLTFTLGYWWWSVVGLAGS